MYLTRRKRLKDNSQKIIYNFFNCLESWRFWLKQNKNASHVQRNDLSNLNCNFVLSYAFGLLFPGRPTVKLPSCNVPGFRSSRK